MLIRCPQCGTGFNLDADRIPSKGAKVRCSACTHTFRVRMKGNGDPEYFYKKGEAPYSGETMIGAPLDIETALGDKSTVAADESTRFGIPQRSKSAAGDYNPFPLAGNITGEQPAITEEQARNDRTQLLGSGSEPEFEELDIDDLLDDEEDDNDRTQLAASGLAEKSQQDAEDDRTQIGGPAAGVVPSRPPPLRTTEDDRRANDRTQAFGSRKLDLFDGEELPPDPQEPPPIDIDPFGDAFEEPVGDVGLLMPSTPTTEDPNVRESTLAAPSSDVSMSEEDFLLGGGTSEFGDALSLVDNSFGDDVPGFDAASGVVDVQKRPRSRRSSAGGRRRNERSDKPLELDDVRDREPQRRRVRTPEPATTTRTAERPRPAPRPAPAYVHQVGAPSAVRRTADVIFITLVVVVAFLALIAARAGGFIDFANFGHMIEVAFSGEEYQPREQWRTIVKIPPPDPPPDEPLRLQNVRALEKPLKDGHVLIVAGKIRNYSLQEFKGVKLRVVVKSGGETIVDRIVVAGQRLDRKALGAAKNLDGVKAALQTKLPDIGKEGTTYFAIVLDDVKSEVVASGNYDYSVAVAD